MNVYIYNAALLCADCAIYTIEELIDKDIKDSGDSDDFPQGPHPNGGGEANSFQYCDACGVFLENPLTPAGLEYELELIEDYIVRRDVWDTDRMSDRLEALESMDLDAPWPKVIELAGRCLDADNRRRR